MNKNMFVFTSLVLSAGVVFAESETEERETFGKWRIGVGAAFNCGVSANLRARQLPAPSMYAIPFGSTKQDALNRALSHQFDGGGYVADDGRRVEGLPGDVTENWKLPVSTYRGNGHFDVPNAYEEVIGSTFANDYRDGSDSGMQYGISLELSRELWIHDEKDEHRWGVDFAAAFSYFFRRNFYNASGIYTRTDSVRNGNIVTPIDDCSAMGEYDPAAVGYPGETATDFPVGGMYGHGNASTPYFYAPALNWSAIGTPYDAGGPVGAVSSSYAYNANGDYRELEMLFMVRPWYEITDWWRVFAQIGLGVSWGKFESSFSTSSGYSCSEDFAQWDCYGVAGLGTAFRYKRFDISIDVLGRFLRDDFAVDGRNLKGTIDRANWGFRVMLGYSF